MGFTVDSQPENATWFDNCPLCRADFRGMGHKPAEESLAVKAGPPRRLRLLTFTPRGSGTMKQFFTRYQCF